mgnify:CR=1 FL=1
MKTIDLKVAWLSSLVLLLMVFSCSKDDVSNEADPVSNPVENPDSNPVPDPDPDPGAVSQDDISQVDGAVQAFLDKYDVPGAAIAVSVNEKMVYTKGYGFSNVEDQTSTKFDDVFRVASLSKTFTSAGILKLVDDGELSLNDKVFGPDGILGDDFGTASLTADELEITVDHLLIHGAGGWSVATGGDPIDFEPQLQGNDFLEYVFNNWDLTNTPGTSFAYSNMGYYLLARIIEKASGQSYEEYVRAFLNPTGITSFKTTTFREDDREANEVEYYGSANDSQFIYTIASRRDGDGGVVISAPDMLRFVCALDGKTTRPDLLSANAHNLMASPSEISHLGRGLGTWEAENLLFFTGSLPGTRTWFYMDTASGVNAVVLLNYRGLEAGFDNDLNTLVYNLVKDGSIPYQTDLDQF